MFVEEITPSPHTHEVATIKKETRKAMEKTSAGKGVEKQEPPCTAGGNAG